MAWISGVPPTPRVWARTRRPLAWVLLALLGAGAACSSDDDGSAEPACVGGGGPALSSESDDHCKSPGGTEIVQSIGRCVSAVDESDAAADEEEMGVFFGREADDDDCKYHISFTNTCITQNQPVTFTVKLTRKSDGAAAPGAVPVNPEIFMAEGSHVSPSNTFSAPEGPPGTYAIGPVEFDRPGRWVVRFHFFETCSDIPDDSPHGHTAFYIDVP
jgi:hypothetical protein